MGRRKPTSHSFRAICFSSRGLSNPEVVRRIGRSSALGKDIWEIMNANFTETGVGYYDGAAWTQALGRP